MICAEFYDIKALVQQYFSRYQFQAPLLSHTLRYYLLLLRCCTRSQPSCTIGKLLWKELDHHKYVRTMCFAWTGYLRWKINTILLKFRLRMSKNSTSAKKYARVGHLVQTKAVFSTLKSCQNFVRQFLWLAHVNSNAFPSDHCDHFVMVILIITAIMHFQARTMSRALFCPQTILDRLRSVQLLQRHSFLMLMYFFYIIVHLELWL